MRDYEDGIHSITNDEYHSCSAVSRSRLQKLKKSPVHYQHPKEFMATSAMAVGSLVHCLVLEPYLFDDEFAVVPEINKRTKLGKQQWEAFCLEHTGKTIITEEQVETANDMARSLLLNDTANKLLASDDLLVEQSIFWTDADSGIQFKARPDAMVLSTGLVIDLKTTADASPWSFTNSAYKFGYFLQAAMISEALRSIGKPMSRFIILAVENTAPYAPAVYVMEQESIDKAIDEFKMLAMQLAECIREDDWRDYGTNLLSMPKYAEYAKDE